VVIAEENVELIDDPELVLGTPFIYAGKFFKRFDPETCRFISNLKEQYPDD
jgi:F-box protein 21